MTIVERLRAALKPVSYYNATEEWGDEWTPYVTAEIPANLLTMRRVKLRSALLARIDQAGEALSLNHALKRVYRDLRTSLLPIVSPLLSCLKKDPAGKSIHWGGNAMYFDIVTQR